MPLECKLALNAADTATNKPSIPATPSDRAKGVTVTGNLVTIFCFHQLCPPLNGRTSLRKKYWEEKKVTAKLFASERN